MRLAVNLRASLAILENTVMRPLPLGLLCLLLPLPASAELTLTRVQPDKVYYTPGETITVEVAVSNPDAAATTAQLTVELIHDLDTAVPLSTATVSPPPGQTQTVTATAKAQPWLGLELRATLRRDGNLLATASEYFTCARTVHQVWLPRQFDNVVGQLTDKQLDDYVNAIPDAYRRAHANGGEQFAWAPSDFDDMTPETERWWAGQAQYNMRKSALIRMHQAARAIGVRPITYGKAGGGGPVTYEFLRQHPEWTPYNEGLPTIGFFDAAFLDYLTALGPPHPDDTRSVVPLLPEEMEKNGYPGAAWFAPFVTQRCVWNDVWYDGANEDVVRFAGREMGESAKMMVYDGVRFDGEFACYRHQLFDGTWNGPPDYDADRADEHMIRLMKQATWEVYPGYLFAYNTTLNFRWNVKLDNAPRGFREKCRNDGLIAREELAFPGNVPWLEYARVVRHDSDLSRYYGGHSAVYPFLRSPRLLYCYLIPFALRCHNMFQYSGPEDVYKFATRYAAFLWDESIHTWTEAPQQVQVAATRDLWWQMFAAVRPRPDGGTYYLLHLINPPEDKTTLASMKELQEGKVPPGMLPAGPAQNVTVAWKQPVRFKRAFVADLDRFNLEPVAAEKRGNAILMRLPDVAHWSLLILESDAPTPPAVWEASTEEAGLQLPTPEELGLAAGSASSSEWRRVFQMEDFYPNSVVATQIFKEADAKAGAALYAPAGGRPYYMAVGTYWYPTIPGEYKVTYRLKVAENKIDQPVLSLVTEDDIPRLPGIPVLNTAKLDLKGTDFKQPGVYQDFSLIVKHPDIGFHAFGGVYTGAGDIWWDQTTVELLRPWTPEELAAYYAPLAAPENLQHNADEKLHVLLVRGVWNRMYHLDEAVARLPEAVATTAYTSYGFQPQAQILGFTWDWEHIYGQDVAVLANFQTRGFALGLQRMLQKRVADGGGLVVLGGLYTLGQGRAMQYGWPEMLPVELNMPFEIRKCDLPVVLGQPDRALGLGRIAWPRPAVVNYRHLVKPKAGTTVLLAGSKGEPLLVGGQYGRGRVVVFTGTVLGEPPAGQVGFWQSPAWADLLAAAIKWAGAGVRG